MTEKEILDYNKRCAEFLGWEYYKGFMMNPLGGNPLTLKLDELKFYSDWNWIMEVIQEIRRLVFPSGLEEIVFRKWEALVNALGLTDKQIVAERLNEFLIWYNKLKE